MLLNDQRTGIVYETQETSEEIEMFEKIKAALREIHENDGKGNSYLPDRLAIYFAFALHAYAQAALEGVFKAVSMDEIIELLDLKIVKDMC